jgi:hypothetical protein
MVREDGARQCPLWGSLIVLINFSYQDIFRLICPNVQTSLKDSSGNQGLRTRLLASLFPSLFLGDPSTSSKGFCMQADWSVV